MVVRATNVRDLNHAAELLQCEEVVVYGDAGCQRIAKRPETTDSTREFRVSMRPGKRSGFPNTPEGRLQDLIEQAKAHLRSKVE